MDEFQEEELDSLALYTKLEQPSVQFDAEITVQVSTVENYI
jgi:hypothetical protein